MTGKKHRGYVGLITILITAVVIAFLIWQWKDFDFMGQGRGIPQEEVEILQKAKDLKVDLELKYR